MLLEVVQLVGKSAASEGSLESRGVNGRSLDGLVDAVEHTGHRAEDLNDAKQGMSTRYSDRQLLYAQ